MSAAPSPSSSDGAAKQPIGSSDRVGSVSAPFKRDDLSTTMQAAVTQARAYGGSLYRHPGGFWTAYERYDLQSKAFGTPTVEGLVSRGVMAYAEWKDGRSGKFPIRAALSKATAE